MGVHQVNVRAFYKRLHGIVNEWTNYLLFYAGITSCFALPLIGVFDCNNFRMFHYFFAFIFFVSTGCYSFFLSKVMYDNRHRFPIADHPTITLSKNLSLGMASLIALLIASYLAFGSEFWTTPVLEWSTVFIHMNYFNMINFTNPFYDSIHPYGHLVMQLPYFTFRRSIYDHK